MRCPKCGYVSFDHNESCPKCNRNLASERDRLNLISFTPDPPYLLGGLLGEVNESGMHYHPASSGAFNVLEEELEFEAETAEMEVPPPRDEQETEIEIELDSIAEEEETIQSEDHEFSTTELETLVTDTEQGEHPDHSLDIDPGQTLGELEIGTDSEAEATKEEPVVEGEPEPLVFEMEDITLEESPTEEEFDLELVDDDLSEVPTEVFETDSGQEDITLEEDISSLDEIAEAQESVISEDTIALPEEDARGDGHVIPEPGIQSDQTLSLDELKDDDLGEVDVTIDEFPQADQKIADGHGG